MLNNLPDGIFKQVALKSDHGELELLLLFSLAMYKSFELSTRRVYVWKGKMMRETSFLNLTEVFWNVRKSTRGYSEMIPTQMSRLCNSIVRLKKLTSTLHSLVIVFNFLTLSLHSQVGTPVSNWLSSMYSFMTDKSPLVCKVDLQKFRRLSFIKEEAFKCHEAVLKKLASPGNHF